MGTVRACRSCGERAEGFQDYCRSCGRRLPRVRWFWRVLLMQPSDTGVRVVGDVLHLLLLLGLLAAVLGDADILVLCGVFVLLVSVTLYRVGRRAARRRHPDGARQDVRRLLDSRIRVELSDPAEAAAIGTSVLDGEIEALVEMGANEIYARLDPALQVLERTWEWMAVMPATYRAPLVELLKSGSMPVHVFGVNQAQVNRALMRFWRSHRGADGVALGAGLATLPGLAR